MASDIYTPTNPERLLAVEGYIRYANAALMLNDPFTTKDFHGLQPDDADALIAMADPLMVEGIQTVMQLLQRLDEKEAEIKRLRNHLEFYL